MTGVMVVGATRLWRVWACHKTTGEEGAGCSLCPLTIMNVRKSSVDTNRFSNNASLALCAALSNTNNRWIFFFFLFFSSKQDKKGIHKLHIESRLQAKSVTEWQPHLPALCRHVLRANIYYTGLSCYWMTLMPLSSFTKSVRWLLCVAPLRGFRRFTAALSTSFPYLGPPHLNPKGTSRVNRIGGITLLSSSTLLL